MSDKKETTSEASEMKEMMAMLLAQQSNGGESTGRRGRRASPDYKITSIQIPTRAKDEGTRETCKVIVNCECDIKSHDDLLQLLIQLEDNDIVPDWWPDKSSRRHSGYNNN